RLWVTGLLGVGGNRRPLGILTARDMRAAPDATVAAAMTPAERLVTAPPEVTPDEARKLLDEHRIEKLPLVAADGRLAGLITLRDLAMEEQYPRATRDGLGRLRGGAPLGVRGGCLPRAKTLLAAGADALVLDIAHGHAEHTIEAIRELKAAWPDCELVAGNVATAQGFADLAAAGADAV